MSDATPVTRWRCDAFVRTESAIRPCGHLATTADALAIHQGEQHATELSGFLCVDCGGFHEGTDTAAENAADLCCRDGWSTGEGGR